MLIAGLYLLVAIALVLRNGFFGLFSDEQISRGRMAILLVLKACAIPLFYFVYTNYYGGFSQSDTGKFYNDAKILNNCAYKHTAVFVRTLFGFDTGNSIATEEHNYCLAQTQNWETGSAKKFFYNDNRIVIRVHSLLHFIAFDSWFVHAFFSCFLSFTGIFFLYRSVKEFFRDKESGVLLILCFLPSLWFHTGALLKEGLLLFVLGNVVWLIHEAFRRKLSVAGYCWLFSLLFISVLLKPYFLITTVFCFLLLFALQSIPNIRFRSVYFLAAFVGGALLANSLSIALKNKSLRTAAIAHQQSFKGASGGGIYLSSDTVFLRLDFDTGLVQKVPGSAQRFRIKEGVPYMYWEDSHNSDTLYKLSNTDTSTIYDLAFMTPPANSDLEMIGIGGRPVKAIIQALYNTLFFPFFLNADSDLQMLASMENLVLILVFIILIKGLFTSKRSRLVPVCFLCITLSVCLIVGLTVPNSGAIFRYRAPAIVFLLLAGLYYFVRPALPQRK